ncbi:unnamed protein product [Diamesa serratosioi]
MFLIIFYTGLLMLGLYFNHANTTLITRSSEDENTPMFHSEAVQGSLARLPCNITSPINGDRVALVIWYKEGQTTPIYSFDARDTSLLDTGSHHEGNSSLTGRSHFNTTLRETAFVISSTKGTDNGLYRCRVDFLKSPTRNIKIQLSVIVPPENVLILNEKGVHIPHYILGPYNEGSSINITCVSTGGRPLPKVTWWRDNVLLNSTTIHLSDKKVKNILQLNKLERRDLHNSYVCQSSNNDVSEPITSSVSLDLNLRPLTIKLNQDIKFLSTNHSYDLKCEVVGARPTPTITWWKGSTQMRTTREWTSTDGNLTRSILSYHPHIEDQGKFLSCRAEQSLIPESGIEQGFKLDIHHVPVLTLEFGTNQQTHTTAIREGADVYFECNIKSNPWVYRVIWKQNGKELANAVHEGIIVANQSLVLQNVSRIRMGQYTCVASNSEGDGESNPVQLDIHFAPICRPGQIITHNVGRGEIAKISCEVEANPTDVQFVWKFNTSVLETLDMPSSNIMNDRSKSIAHYKPMTEHDYGTLLCWGGNDIGTQTEPCVFNIIPAGKPDPLSNCTILNQTFDMIQITCSEGFDGGLPQEFLVELCIVGSNKPMYTSFSKTPFFDLKGLEPGQGYDIYIMAMNKKGKSASTKLLGFTMKNPEKQTVVFPFSDIAPAFPPTFHQIKPFLGTIGGVIGILVMLLAAIILIVRLRRTKTTKQTRSSQITNDMSSTMSPSLQNGVLLREACSVDSIDKNPDIIPQGNATTRCTLQDNGILIVEYISTEKKSEDDEEWMNNNRLYATAVMQEQQHNYGIGTTPSYDRTLFASHDNNCMQQHNIYQQEQPQPPPRQGYIPVNNQMMPVTSLGYNTRRGSTELTYADLTIMQKPMYSATLGRPRHKAIEPSIYAQIDLAHHTPPPPPSVAQQIYPTNLIFSSARGNVPISHPSQSDRLPPPALFSNDNNSSKESKSILQTVPEIPMDNGGCDRVPNHTTRF